MAFGERGFVTFDLETTGLIEEGAPLPQVLCAATMVMHRIEGVAGKFSTEPTVTWPSQEGLPESRPPIPMDTDQLLVLVDYLCECCGTGEVRLLAWNGVGYDLRLLHALFTSSGHPRAQEAALRVKQLALCSCDPMLAFAFGRGFPVGLQATASVLPSGAMYKTGEGVECEHQWMEVAPALCTPS